MPARLRAPGRSSELFAFLQHLHGLRALPERHDPVDEGPQLPGMQQGGDRSEVLMGPHGAPDQRDLFGKDVAQVDFRHRSAGVSHDDDTPAARRRFDTQPDGGAPTLSTTTSTPRFPVSRRSPRPSPSWNDPPRNPRRALRPWRLSGHRRPPRRR